MPRHKYWFAITLSVLSIVLFVQATSAARIGQVTFISGDVFLKQKSGKSKKMKVQFPVKAGQVFITGSESLLEITYSNGTVLRVGENSDVILSGKNSSAPFLNKGKVWANIRKMSKRNGPFTIQTVTATAAVRGTVFSVEAGADSSATVALFKGTVDVGPSDTTSIAIDSSAHWGPPKEIKGPYEVSLETWITLTPGQEIHIKSNGKYNTREIDSTATTQWLDFNKKRDSELDRQ
ncbi:MAG: FecR domain-containing protein [Fibrobacterales bacterium]